MQKLRKEISRKPKTKQNRLTKTQKERKKEMKKQENEMKQDQEKWKLYTLFVIQ